MLIRKGLRGGYTSTCMHLYMNPLITCNYLLQISFGPLKHSSQLVQNNFVYIADVIIFQKSFE